jgi:hypothetical protein
MPIIALPIDPDGAFVQICIHLSAPKIQALQQANQPLPPPVVAKGLIDTGAACTAIDLTIVQQLGLAPTGMVPIVTPSTGASPHLANQYDVSVAFAQSPGLGLLPVVHPIHFVLPVIEVDLSAQGFEALIGRDVLERCLLVYHGATKQFSLSYY